MKAYFVHKGKRFKAVIKKTNSPSNYNHFASFFESGGKTPLLGYSVKETTTMKEVIAHFKLSYDRYQSEQLQLKAN